MHFQLGNHFRCCVVVRCWRLGRFSISIIRFRSFRSFRSFRTFRSFRSVWKFCRKNVNAPKNVLLSILCVEYGVGSSGEYIYILFFLCIVDTLLKFLVGGGVYVCWAEATNNSLLSRWGPDLDWSYTASLVTDVRLQASGRVRHPARSLQQSASNSLPMF